MADVLGWHLAGRKSRVETDQLVHIGLSAS
jgi:hypothetical protein